MADVTLSTGRMELQVAKFLGLPVHQSTLWLDFGDILREGEMKGEQRRIAEEEISDLKAERDSLEQRIIWLTSRIRELQEELAK